MYPTEHSWGVDILWLAEHGSILREMSYGILERPLAKSLHTVGMFVMINLGVIFVFIIYILYLNNLLFNCSPNHVSRHTPSITVL